MQQFIVAIIAITIEGEMRHWNFIAWHPLHVIAIPRGSSSYLSFRRRISTRAYAFHSHAFKRDPLFMRSLYGILF